MNLLLSTFLLLGLVGAVFSTTCDECTSTYTSARDAAGDNGGKCTALKAYLMCLETSARTDAGCPLSASSASAISTDYSAASCDFAAAGSACLCQKTYWETDITDATVACTAAKTRVSCLIKATTDNACDGTGTLQALGTKTETIINAITGPACTLGDACTCELNYAKSDRGNDDKKCTEAKKYISCLKGKTGNGCDGSTSVVDLATAAETYIDGLTGCSIAADSACKCDVDYAKADISDNCAELKKYIVCLKGKTGNGCDGSTIMQLAGNTKTTVSELPSCIADTTVCKCELDHLASDVSDAEKTCTANKNYISCLMGKSGNGCDGSTSLKSLAETTKTAIGTTCSKTSVCDCEIAYTTADVATNGKKCTETKTLTSCIQHSIENGCGASTTKTTVGEVAQTVFTAIASDCTLTDTCQCQVNFNKASVTSADKCKSATDFIGCFEDITSTTDKGCDGTISTADLKTNITTSVKNVLCSTAGIRMEGSLVSAILMLITSTLIISL